MDQHFQLVQRRDLYLYQTHPFPLPLSSSGTMSKESAAQPQYYETRQTLYIVRHAVASHNIPVKVKSNAEDGSETYTYHHPDKRDPKYLDSKLLLPKAHQQARKAGIRLKKVLEEPEGSNCITTTITAKKKLDCVVVSPLSRCLETAYFIMNELQDNFECYFLNLLSFTKQLCSSRLEINHVIQEPTEAN